jgi:hypothetical protein
LLQEAQLMFPPREAAPLPPSAPSSFSYREYYDSLTSVAVATRYTVQEEIEAFLTYVDPPRNSSAEEFWRGHHQMFPKVALIARKFLCQPLHEIGVERMFSMSEGVVTKKRNRLKPATVNAIVQTNYNVSQLEKHGLYGMMRKRLDPPVSCSSER